jgi:hypothetical protein
LPTNHPEIPQEWVFGKHPIRLSDEIHRLVQHLLFQDLNAFLLLLHLAVGMLLSLKGGRSILEELILPAVEYRGLQAQLSTQVRNWRLVQMPPRQQPSLQQ